MQSKQGEKMTGQIKVLGSATTWTRTWKTRVATLRKQGEYPDMGINNQNLRNKMA